jgi:DNA mismatch repair protein MutS2
MARLEERLSAIPTVRRDPLGTPSEGWRTGQRAATLAGWEGVLTALDTQRGRATLEAGGARVEVALADLIAPGGTAAVAARPSMAPTAGRPTTGRRGDFGGGEPPPATRPRPTPPRTGQPARAIPSSLDLRGARVDEALELLEQYLDQAALASAGRVTIIHGHGSGALRDAVRDRITGHPLVREWRPGDRGEGGDGATIVSL